VKLKTRLFLILWLAGMIGVLSFLLVDVNALVAKMPIPPGTEIPNFTLPLKFLSLIQPAVILAFAVLLGVALASKVGLSSPVAEALASGGRLGSAFKPQILPGIVGGLAGGAAIVLNASLSKQFLAPEVTTRIAEFGTLLPVPTRLLYGGILEELLLRWGLMTLLVWAAWRVFQKARGRPKPAYFILAILISAVLFGMGHLPIAIMLFPKPGLALISFVIVANSIFGLIAGYLYWKKGLESAVVAHMLTHLVLLTATYFGAYF
jgi:hypothetical protein